VPIKNPAGVVEREGKMAVMLDEAADPQQIIADLKRALAESNAERDEALTREIATAEV